MKNSAVECSSVTMETECICLYEGMHSAAPGGALNGRKDHECVFKTRELNQPNFHSACQIEGAMLLI